MGILNVGKILASIGLKLQAITGGETNYPVGEEGLIVYDKDNNQLKIFDGTEWGSINITGAFDIQNTGASLAYDNGNEHWLVFRSPGSFTVSGNGSMDILCVGGGGGGSVPYGGGGGAGGVIFYPNAPVSGGNYPVSVGTGGPGNPSNPGDSGSPIKGAIPGNPSTIGGPLSLVAVGGGRGGGQSFVAEPGGSGGAARGNGTGDPAASRSASQPSQPGNSGLFGHGFPGGSVPSTQYGAGGGGAGGAGENLNGGKGGDGYAVPSGFLPNGVPQQFQDLLGGIPATGPYAPHWRYFGAGGSGDPRGPGTNAFGLGGGGSRELDPVGGWATLGTQYGYQPMDAVNGRGSGGGSGNSSPLDWGDGGDGVVIIKWTT